MGKHRRTTERAAHEPQRLAKTLTGIAGLDDILEGGFPAGRTTLISGGPGTGKTMLGVEFLYKSALAGKAGILLLFEERAEAIRRNVRSLGWDLAAMEAAGKLFILEARLPHEAVLSGDFNITPLLAIIEGKAKAIGADRVTIDAIDVLMRIYSDARREQSELCGLHDWLMDRGFTTILTAKKAESSSDAKYEFLEYMADCVISLNLRVAGQVTTRRLRIIKYRGSGFASNEYPYLVGGEGNVIMPISTVSLEHKPLGARISSGNRQLDALLGGGYRRGASILITGASGTGKTTLACTFVQGACGRGEKVLYVSFEESGPALIDAMLSPGVDLRPAVKVGRLEFLTIMPEAMGAEQHLLRALSRIKAFEPQHIVIDAISALQRVGDDRAAFDYLMRLVDFAKQQGITTLMTNQLAGNFERIDFSGLGFSSLIDTIILLRFVEVHNKISRSLLILKSRGARHSNSYHRYVITDNGIEIATIPSGAKLSELHARPATEQSYAETRRSKGGEA
jgi:circadian clock protein KaiC